MTPRNYLYLLKKYDEYQVHIERLLESIITAQPPTKLENSNERILDAIHRLHQSYPFVELLYCVDEQGVQVTESASAPKVADSKRREPGLGSDRSNRAYYLAARDNTKAVTVTQPYLSSATHQLAISGVQRFNSSAGGLRYLVLNVNLEKLIAFLNGDSLRSLVHPFFQLIYGVIGVMLVVVARRFSGAMSKSDSRER